MRTLFLCLALALACGGEEEEPQVAWRCTCDPVGPTAPEYPCLPPDSTADDAEALGCGQCDEAGAACVCRRYTDRDGDLCE